MENLYVLYHELSVNYGCTFFYSPHLLLIMNKMHCKPNPCQLVSLDFCCFIFEHAAHVHASRLI